MNIPIPTATLVTVTPEMAREWLEANENNRNVRDRRVDLYSSEMEAGDWMITGEGVKFDWNGRLFDGQHRLKAVIKAGVPVQMFAFHNLDPEAQKVVDTGAKRTAADALRFAGITRFVSEIASMAKIVIAWDEGGYRRSGSNSHPDVPSPAITDWSLENIEAATAAADLASQVYRSPFPVLSRSTLAAALFMISRVDEAEARKFAADMIDLRLSGAGDPLYTLHRRIESAIKSREAVGTAGQLFFYFRAWNARRKGERLSVIKIGSANTAAGVATDIAVPAPI
ncbi:hypothetical protein AAI421_17900 [Rhodococcus aetherivorans]|uniref:hypothetical protein n=1 Tax=Rhodococcus aetherivorans TaxID=191292 RepID=UPI0031D39C0C